MSLIDALNRISEIESQLSSVTGGASPADPTADATSQPVATAATAATPATSFANVLEAAQGAPGTTAPGTLPATALGTFPPTTAPVGMPGVGGATSVPGASMLTSDQQQFAARLAQQTGLDPSMVSAWLLAEESGGAAQSRQSANNNDWLNIGYTDSGTYGAQASVWSNPVSAADATAGWLKGQDTIPGYGTAAPGIQAVLGTAGQPPETQIAALQRSGWASSGYPDLPALLQQVEGASAASVSMPATMPTAGTVPTVDITELAGLAGTNAALA